MLSWLAHRDDESRVDRCIKAMKWELQWANLVKRATILALAQRVRVRFAETATAEALDRPLDCRRDVLLEIFRRLEGFKDRHGHTLDATSSTIRGTNVELSEMLVEHAGQTTRGVEVWMCTLGAGIIPHSREDVVLIWSYLTSSFSYVEQAIGNLRHVENLTREATGEADAVLPPIADEEWKKLCTYAPSTLRPMRPGLAQLREAPLLGPTMDGAGRGLGRKG